ncbi:MAG TPA: phosphoglucosamine mutase, partial [Proteiniclasticum sp.]|nr:phosphoglucosamine mutase [Proteiniclasticum sp.]
MSRMFGTDGVRGIANSELTPELAFQLGKAGALVLTKGTHKPKILVAKDTRISGDLLENAMVSGMLSVGAEAVLLGVVPTPAVALLVREYKADAGVMISASHNPVEFNGIKFFNREGFKLSDSLEDEIQKLIEDKFDGIPILIGGDIGHVSYAEGATRDYVDFAVKTLEGDLSGMKIALDCANGASYKSAVDAFEKLGAEVFVIHNEPNGVNINAHCGSTHPEDLMKFVVENGCDLGLAFDGDADRCLAVDEKGNLVNGDFIILVAGLYLKEKGRLKDDTIVVTVMSNLGMMLAAKELGLNVAVTAVGDRYVLENIMDNNYSIGGEQSGHVIFKDFNTTGDGIVTGVQL